MPLSECKEGFYLTWKHVAVRKGWIPDNNICRKWSMENLRWKSSFLGQSFWRSREMMCDGLLHFTSHLLFSIHLLSIRSSVLFFSSSFQSRPWDADMQGYIPKPDLRILWDEGSQGSGLPTHKSFPEIKWVAFSCTRDCFLGMTVKCKGLSWTLPTPHTLFWPSDGIVNHLI